MRKVCTAAALGAIVGLLVSVHAQEQAPGASVSAQWDTVAVKAIEAEVEKAGTLTSVIVNKLSPEQITDVLKAMEQRKADEAKSNSPFMKGFDPVAFAAVTLFFGTVVIAIFIPLFMRFRKNRMTQETVRLMVEKGASIPPELLIEPVAPTSDLRRGIKGLAFGLGLTLFLVAFRDLREEGLWAVGLIPLFVGLGHLAIWKVEKVAGGTNGASKE